VNSSSSPLSLHVESIVLFLSRSNSGSGSLCHQGYAQFGRQHNSRDNTWFNVLLFPAKCAASQIRAQGLPQHNCCNWIILIPGHTIKTQAAFQYHDRVSGYCTLSPKGFTRRPGELLEDPILLDIKSRTPVDTGVSGVTNGRSRLPIPQNHASVAVSAVATVTYDHPLGFRRSLGPCSQVVAVTADLQTADTGDTDGYGKNCGKTRRNIIVAHVAIKGREHNIHYRNFGRANAF
jgi:hypothetical protein